MVLECRLLFLKIYGPTCVIMCKRGDASALCGRGGNKDTLTSVKTRQSVKSRDGEISMVSGVTENHVEHYIESQWSPYWIGKQGYYNTPV